MARPTPYMQQSYCRQLRNKCAPWPQLPGLRGAGAGMADPMPSAAQGDEACWPFSPSSSLGRA